MFFRNLPRLNSSSMTVNRMKVSLLLWGLALLVSPSLFAQEGNFLLTHHIPRALGLDHTNFDILYGKNGLVNVANRQGILQYDGHRWEFVYTPMAAFSLAEDEEGALYVAGEGDFGKVSYSESGQLLYQSLSQSSDLQSKAWTDVEVLDDKVYFLSMDEVVVFDPTVADSALAVIPNQNGHFRSMHKEKNRLLVQGEGLEILSITAEGIENLTEGILPDSIGSLALVAYDPMSQRSLLGTHDQLWLRDQDSLRIAFPNLDSLLAESWLLEAKWLRDTLVAVGTLNQGVLFLNPESGELVQHINYHTGLPDNEVLAMEVDQDLGVWVAHEFGFSRISPGLPIRSFAHYPGLEGNLLAVKRHQGQLFVATSLGVFYLEQINNFRETVYYVRKRTAPVPARTRTAPVSQPNPTPEDAEEPEEKGNFFTNLFSKEARERRKAERERQRAERQAARQRQREQQAVETENFFQRLFRPKAEEEEAPQIKYERRIRRELQSVRYVFKKVEGLDAKCKQLVTFGEKLLVASHSGVYEVTEGKAVLISDQPVQYLFPAYAQNKLILSTLYDEVLLLEPIEDLWLESPLSEELIEPVIHINESQNDLWLVSPDHAVRMDWSDSTRTLHAYPIRNPNYEPIYAVPHAGTMYFVNGEGFRRYDASKDSILVDESMTQELGPIQEYHFANPGHLWVYNGRKWNELSPKEGEEAYLDYLLLFDRVQHLSIDDETGFLWVTTPEEEMYQYNFLEPPVWQDVHELVLKGIHGQGGVFLPRQDFVVNKENSFVSFEFTRPDFLGKLGIEYRYRLAGLNKEWSSWDDQSTITFNYLPPGEYTLEVQARDAFGNQNDPYSVAFAVVPPWWERGWFYALEVLFFGTILLLSFRVNRTKMRRSLLSRILTYLTLILIIEFLQNLTKTQLTLGGNPFVDFMLEAAIAVALLPIEGVLRRFIRSSDNNKSKTATST